MLRRAACTHLAGVNSRADVAGADGDWSDLEAAADAGAARIRRGHDGGQCARPPQRCESPHHLLLEARLHARRLFVAHTNYCGEHACEWSVDPSGLAVVLGMCQVGGERTRPPAYTFDLGTLRLRRGVVGDLRYGTERQPDGGSTQRPGPGC